MRKIQIHLVLAFMFMINGCGFLGIDLTETRTIAISKPPYTITLDGDLEQKDLDKAQHILEFLATQKHEGIVNPNFRVHVEDQNIIVKGAKVKEQIDIREDPAQVME